MGKTIQQDLQRLEDLAFANYKLLQDLEGLLSSILYPELTNGCVLKEVGDSQKYEVGEKIEKISNMILDSNSKIGSIKGRLALEQTNPTAILSVTSYDWNDR